MQAAHRVRAAVLQALDLEALPAALQRAAHKVGVGRGQRGHAPEWVLGLVQQAVPAAPLCQSWGNLKPASQRWTAAATLTGECLA